MKQLITLIAALLFIGQAYGQPSGTSVRVTSSALPTGACTESTLSTLNGKVTACNTGAVVVSSAPTTAVTGTFWQATQPVSGTLTCNAGTGTLSVNTAQINGVATTMGNGVSGTGVQRVTLASDSTGQVTLAAGANTIGALTANQSVNIAQMNGVATTTGNGIAGTGVQRVAIASDNTAFTVNAAQSGTWNVTNVSGTVSLPTGASTAAKQPALGTAGVASADVLSVQGIASMTPLLVNGSAVTQPVSGTLTCNAGTGTLSVNTAQINGVTTTTGNGISGTGVQRVTLASDSTGQVVLAAGANTIGALTANQSVNQTQVNGVAVSTGNGVTGTGVQRVTISSDNTAFTVNAAQSGTWTVQPGNTQNTTPWLVQNAPVTTGGFTTYHLVSAATTNATNIKATAGQLYGWYIYNSNAAMRKVCLHNSATAPTAGASIFFCIPLPGGAAANVFSTIGIPFSAGIGITTTTDLTDAGATAVALNDLNINLFYR